MFPMCLKSLPGGFQKGFKPPFCIQHVGCNFISLFKTSLKVLVYAGGRSARFFGVAGAWLGCLGWQVLDGRGYMKFTRYGNWLEV